MTAAQTLCRELADIARSLELRLGPTDLAGDAVRAEVERAGRTVTALGALVGLAPRVEVVTGEAPVSRVPGRTPDQCPKCGEKLRLVPTAGFGASSRDICGACGHEPAAA